MRAAPQIISLDGTLPPAFVQHLHMVDVPRLARSKPWLTHGDVVMEELLNILHFTTARAAAAASQDAGSGGGQEQRSSHADAVTAPAPPRAPPASSRVWVVQCLLAALVCLLAAASWRLLGGS